jgi:hypothetical protein
MLLCDGALTLNIMKHFLIKYDLNCNGYLNLIALVYANSYEEAIEKIIFKVEKDFCKSDCVRIVKHCDLTII